MRDTISRGHPTSPNIAQMPTAPTALIWQRSKGIRSSSFALFCCRHYIHRRTFHNIEYFTRVGEGTVSLWGAFLPIYICRCLGCGLHRSMLNQLKVYCSRILIKLKCSQVWHNESTVKSLIFEFRLPNIIIQKHDSRTLGFCDCSQRSQQETT